MGHRQEMILFTLTFAYVQNVGNEFCRINSKKQLDSLVELTLN